MDIISEVLKETAEIRKGVDNLTIDLGVFSRPKEVRQQLKMTLTDQITPLLTANGFVRRNCCFFRAHEDAMLQIIGVVYPHNGNFFIASIVQPLYDFFHPVSEEGNMIHDLIGLRRNLCPDAAKPIEITLGLNDQRKILSDQYDYEKPFQAMYVLLEQEIIPRLDSCTTGMDCIRYNQYDKSKILWDVPSTMISLYCRDYMYDECLRQIEKCMNYINEWIKGWSEDELLPYPVDGPVIFNDEHSQAGYDQHTRIRNKALQFGFKARALLEKLADLVARKDEKELMRMMDQSIRTEYSYLGKVSKQFVKKYPLQHLLHEDG